MAFIREWGHAPFDAIRKLGLEDAAERLVRRGAIQKVGDAYLGMRNTHPEHHIRLAIAGWENMTAAEKEKWREPSDE